MLLPLGRMPVSADEPPAFVGAPACTGCHAAEFDAWKGSHHARAMQPATAATVLGDFTGAKLEHFGVTTTFFRDGDKFIVRTNGPDGALHAQQTAFVKVTAELVAAENVDADRPEAISISAYWRCGAAMRRRRTANIERHCVWIRRLFQPWSILPISTARGTDEQGAELLRKAMAIEPGNACAAFDGAAARAPV